MNAAPVATPAPAQVTAARFSGVSKTFPGGKALDAVSFSVDRGRIHCLLGGNGSGKSTLVKGLAGVQNLDAGGAVVVGEHRIDASAITPNWAFDSGMRFVHQNPGVFPGLTVADNLCLGHGFPSTAGVVRGRRQLRAAEVLLARFDIDVSPRARMGELRLADQTMIAIARALQDIGAGGGEISLLVLDEPTAALPDDEVTVLLDAVRRTADMGVGVLYISHRIEEILAIADDVTVLRDGSRVTTMVSDNLTESQLIAHIVGAELSEVFPSGTSAPAGSSEVPALKVSGLCAGPLEDVDLEVRKGEIVGVAGLLGAGRTELLQSLFGGLKIASGTVELDGSAIDPRSPADAMKRGIAYVPEKRDEEAAFSDLPVSRNISVADQKGHTRFGFVRRKTEKAQARRTIDEFAIRADGEEALMSSLSGGNQQRVVLARWLRRSPRLILLDEPTIGVDVGARADAYRAIRKAVDAGAAVLLVSSDFEELAEMSDRVLILTDGRVSGELSGAGLDRQHLTEQVYNARSKGKRP